VPNLYEDEHGVIRALVDRLGHDLEPSILIGGWATFVRIGGEIIAEYDWPPEGVTYVGMGTAWNRFGGAGQNSELSPMS
jgi:hypothetical protein